MQERLTATDRRTFARVRFRNLAIDLCVIAAAGIVLLVVEVPIGSFYVAVLMGFSLALVIGLLMLGTLWLVFRKPPVLRGEKNSVAALGLLVPTGCLIALVVAAAVSYPTHGTTAELVLVIGLAVTALLATAWIAVMLAKSIAEHAWTPQVPTAP